MKKLLIPLAIVGLLTLAQFIPILTIKAAPSQGESEIVKALNIQNQQLSRIATSLEKISGQQPGWKLPN
jgi:DNA-binding MarR family transcriptional regulator